jgi:hypothetical protein
VSEQDRVQYHSKRALQELDFGLTASSTAAARAHLRLSSLHMEQARALGGSPLAPRPILAMD